MAKLEYYEKQTEKEKCRFCNGYLGTTQSYEHEGGWYVDEFKKKMWLYRTCMICGHQWSLQHLGIKRYFLHSDSQEY